MSRFMLAIIGVLLAAETVPAQGPPVNRRIYPSTVTQTEPVITVSPVNSNLLFASAVTINTGNGFKSEGVYVSTDGGLSWTGSDTCKGEALFNHGGDPGVMIHSNGRFVITHIGSVFAGMYSHYSADMGGTWTTAYTISSDQPEDKGGTTIDNNPSSPFYGRIYAAWVRFLVPYPVSFSYTSNAGTSWSAVTAINGTPPARCSGGTLATGTDGRVYATWAGMTPTPFTEDFAGFASSTNGGLSWSVQQNIFDMNGINGTFSFKGNIRVNGLPQIAVDNSGGVRNGWLYIITTERNLAPAGADADIILHRSTDGGQTWSAGIRVNQDPVNNGKTQYFPAPAVDDQGGLNILFYDDRNTSNDSSEVYLARSTDGGNTWSEYLISDHRFKPKPIVGGSSNYQGDHIALLAVGTRLHALWMDDFPGIYQVWHAIIDVDPNDVPLLQPTTPASFRLQQNYPNPFNPSTTIGYELPQAGLVRLRVYDQIGREITTLVDERREAGRHSVSFQATDFGLSSGMYYYRLTTPEGTLTRSMVLAK